MAFIIRAILDSCGEDSKTQQDANRLLMLQLT